MKTINQMAQSLGVTRQTIYNVVNNTPGMSIDSLTTARQGKTRLFDDEAEKTVKKLLSARKGCKATTDNAAAQRMAEDLEAARAEIQKLTEDLARANNRIDALIKTNMELATTKAQALPAGKEPGRIRKAWRALTGKAEE